ncbi:MAG: cyclic nucleotide-binding domain-containing protein [Spirochaetales bacterium]|nr:cyclic nucleotide-binding domain-containing protein [Spirochaetales bacterium]
MTGGKKYDLWKKAGLFQGLDPETAEKTAQALEEYPLDKGAFLFHQGDLCDSAYVIASGSVEILADGDKERIGVLQPGDPVGELHLLTGGRRTAGVRALETSLLVRLRRETFESVAAASPAVLKEMEELIRRRIRHYRVETVLPLLFGPLPEEVRDEIERVAEWIRLRRGEYLFRQGEDDQSLCVLMHGRLAAEVETPEGRQLAGQIFAGECVGEMALFTGETRSAHVFAARDSEAILISPETFRGIISSHPELVMAMTRIIIRRLRRNLECRSQDTGVTNFAVLPLSPKADAAALARKLIMPIHPRRVLLLSSGEVDRLVGLPGTANIPEDNPNAMRLEIWLDEQEGSYDYVMYIPDTDPTPWTWRCVRRADRLLLLGDAEGTPEESPLEKTLLQGPAGEIPPATLVLLHPPETALPSGTGRWLACRKVEGVVHVRAGRDADYERLARLLTGQAVTLVLSGGGAKGFAHIGVLRALKEKGIPVDMIGGTSMGAVVSAGHAMGIDPRDLVTMLKGLFARHKPFKDYTLPLVSLLRGRRLERMLSEQLGDVRIEDLWTGYFCVASDLTAADAWVHTSGPLLTAVLSSISLPGVFPPVILEDRLLVDGGVVNNLPGDVMRAKCRGTLIAVDVAPTRDVEVPRGSTVYPSARQILRQKLLPRSRRAVIPTLSNILFRTTMLGSVQRINSVKDMADFYLRPPVEGFGMLEFESLEEIVEAGYRYAKDYLKEEEGIDDLVKALGGAGFVT